MEVKMNSLNQKQQSILDYLKKQSPRWVKPTELGMILGDLSYCSASSWASGTLKLMVKKGLVERNDKGQYRYKEKDGS